jgi:hypothetical protein
MARACSSLVAPHLSGRKTGPHGREKFVNRSHHLRALANGGCHALDRLCAYVAYGKYTALRRL